MHPTTSIGSARDSRAQGSLDYILLIGGAVLISTIILVIVLQSTGVGHTILEGGVTTYQDSVNLDAFTGGGGSAPDTTPPVVSFSVTSGNGEATIQYSGVDASPITYTVIYSRFKVRIENYTDEPPYNAPPFNYTFDNLPPQVFHVTTNTALTLHNVPQSGTFIQQGLTNGSVYYYRIRACDAFNNCYKMPAPAIVITPAPPSNISVALSPSVTYVMNYPQDACDVDPNEWDFPDVGARAVRTGAGIVLSAGNSPNSYFMFGPDFDSLTRSCTPVFSAGNIKHPNPTAASSFNNQEWISTIYNDAGTIHALIHNEFHDADPAHDPPCISSPYSQLECWYNGLTHATSMDNGHTFVQTNTPSDVVAAPPEVWNHVTMANNPYGYFGPTNILRRPDNYYYTIIQAHTQPGDSEVSGNCVMRTNDLSNNASWRAYNASTGQYDITMFSPYTTSGQPPCSFVSNGTVQGMIESITYNAYFASKGLGPYLAVGTAKFATCGVYFSHSADLINWSVPQLLMQAPLTWGSCGLSGHEVAYVSLIDHSDTDPSFQNTGQTAYLYYTDFNSNLDRDLVRRQVTFTIT